jgi:uncharacterized protein (DUF1684 family)
MLAMVAGMLLAATPYQTEIDAWHKSREASLRSETGWLTVTGLFWLREGANKFGSAADNDVVLPATVAAQAGTFWYHDGAVTVEMNGAKRALQPDSRDAVELGPVTLTVIRRGDRMGIRMRDRNSALLREFHGLHYFPADEKNRVVAEFVAEPRKIPVTNVLGQSQPMDSPGYAVFQWQGQQVRLYPVIESPEDKDWFYIFRDQTSGHETYGAGRFLYSGPAENNKITIDFNRAYNPPCAFTPYATCPLPPKENRLAVKIEAGELKYGDH